MRLESDVSSEGKTVSHVRIDQIGGACGLWWVALQFADGSTKPEGMFPSRADADALAGDLASKYQVEIRVNAS